MEANLKIAVLTVSDTRTLETDTSGQFLCDALAEANHILQDRTLIADDIYLLRAKVSAWIADPEVEVVLLTEARVLPIETRLLKPLSLCWTQLFPVLVNCSGHYHLTKSAHRRSSLAL